jgi:hypothetical protein
MVRVPFIQCLEKRIAVSTLQKLNDSPLCRHTGGTDPSIRKKLEAVEQLTLRRLRSGGLGDVEAEWEENKVLFGHFSALTLAECIPRVAGAKACCDQSITKEGIGDRHSGLGGVGIPIDIVELVDSGMPVIDLFVHLYLLVGDMAHAVYCSICVVRVRSGVSHVPEGTELLTLFSELGPGIITTP